VLSGILHLFWFVRSRDVYSGSNGCFISQVGRALLERLFGLYLIHAGRRRWRGRSVCRADIFSFCLHASVLDGWLYALRMAAAALYLPGRLPPSVLNISSCWL
jgi:hypothetical protein